MEFVILHEMTHLTKTDGANGSLQTERTANQIALIALGIL